MPIWAHPRSRGENQVAARLSVGRVGSSPLTRGKRDLPHVDKLRAGLIPAHAGKTKKRAIHFMTHWAHPRSRGENITAAMGVISGVGSSPLTRGKPFTGSDQEAAEGLIPAHAGKTTDAAPATALPGAHPRSRGENLESRRR